MTQLHDDIVGLDAAITGAIVRHSRRQDEVGTPRICAVSNGNCIASGLPDARLRVEGKEHSYAAL